MLRSPAQQWTQRHECFSSPVVQALRSGHSFSSRMVLTELERLHRSDQRPVLVLTAVDELFAEPSVNSKMREDDMEDANTCLLVIRIGKKT